MCIILQLHPGIALLAGLIAMVVLFWFLWPKKGGLALITKLFRNNERVLLEDALKFIFDCEYNKTTCNTNSLSGNLNVALDKTSRLLSRLTELELVTLKNQTVSLTEFRTLLTLNSHKSLYL